MSGAPPPLTHADVRAAAERIGGHAVYTPALECEALNQMIGGRALIKAECLQHTGSFKFRGAFNRLSQLTAEQRQAGVVAWSSGNHAQGIALAARLLGMQATIVMPADAPRIKFERTRAFDAHIVPYDRHREQREEIAHELVARSGAVLVPSYDDYDVMAGQGTCALELSDQARIAGAILDSVLVPAGGGGLCAGVVTALAEDSPETAVYTVEPDHCDDHARSFGTGQREHNPPEADSICDALLAPSPGALTFPINQQRVRAGLTVTDTHVRSAMRFAFQELKLVVEPGGAVGLAALLSHPDRFRGETVGVIVSGGNVDAALFARVISETG